MICSGMRTVLFSHFFVSPGGVRLDFSFPYSSPPSEWISIGSPLRHSNRAKPPGPIRQLQNLHLNSKEERKAKKKTKTKKNNNNSDGQKERNRITQSCWRQRAGETKPKKKNGYKKKKYVHRRIVRTREKVGFFIFPCLPFFVFHSARTDFAQNADSLCTAVTSPIRRRRRRRRRRF